MIGQLTELVEFVKSPAISNNALSKEIVKNLTGVKKGIYPHNKQKTR